MTEKHAWHRVYEFLAVFYSLSVLLNSFFLILVSKKKTGRVAVFLAVQSLHAEGFLALPNNLRIRPRTKRIPVSRKIN